uniref:Methyltransferase type 11 n=1 Tax=uncultured bacterium Contig46 TaxID=1393580 RepID=W0FM97_9BACT|nr:methyltransferase type 11 [uncultured bacterium Contig46]
MQGPDGTLNWYRENAEEFIARTADADLSALYSRFASLVPSGGRIMDLGCGAGSAALYFTRQGYDVLAVDGCRELCEYTRKRAGCPVRCLRFEELDYTDAFDGIWACASLLHVRKAGLPGVVRLVYRALRQNGVFYTSFKYGDSERESNGRFFSDFTEESVSTLLKSTGGFQDITVWTTGDARLGRAGERWVNALCRAGKL